jgi:tripartite-type tricarboxylate transporter receptor subunit TctC
VLPAARRSALLLLTLITVLPLQAAAQDGEPFYKGKVVSVIMPFTSGGGYDFYARLAARHLGKHLPGAPSVIVRYMPGAGGLTALNHLFNRAPADGTVIGVPPADIVLNEALNSPGVEYKVAAFNWIGRISDSAAITITWHTSKVKTIEDAKRVEAILAGAGPGAPGTENPKLLNRVIGTKFKVVPGYRSAAEALLAMERGEVDGAYTSWSNIKSTKEAWLRDKRINILVVYTTARSAEMPNVPSMVELGASEQDRQALLLYASGGEIGKSLIAPPGTSPQRLAELRAGFDLMIKDPALLAEIEAAKADFGPLSAKPLQEIVARIADSPSHVANRP